MPGADPIRVLVVEDQQVFAEALRLFLQRDRRIDVVGVAYDGGQAVDLALTNDAEVVVMDLGLPRVDGLEATRRLLAIRPWARVIVLTGRSDDGAEAEALAAGAAGFVTKGGVAETEALIEKILEVAPPRAH